MHILASLFEKQYFADDDGLPILLLINDIFHLCTRLYASNTTIHLTMMI